MLYTIPREKSFYGLADVWFTTIGLNICRAPMPIHYILQNELYDVLKLLATNKLGLYPSGKVVYTHYKIIGRITPHNVDSI